MASAAIHGLLLACWLNLKPVPSGATNNVIIELVNIDSVPAHQSAPPAPEPAMPPAEQKTGIHAPVVRQPAKPISKTVVAIKKTKPTAIQVAQQRALSPATDKKPTFTALPPKAASNAVKQRAQPVHATTAADMDRVRKLLHNHLESYKYYPASARRRGIEGHVDVGFTLTRNGAADQVSVLHGSGYAVLDHAALETVYRAQPFPIEDGQYHFRLRFKRL
ncbi:MAG: energy transducer TonB [Mariprofundus sp.]|nr:energy transducer TonB [Mariprofundus sp.]